MDAELVRISDELLELRRASNDDMIQSALKSIPDDVKYACIYLAAKGNNHYQPVCNKAGWSY